MKDFLKNKKLLLSGGIIIIFIIILIVVLIIGNKSNLNKKHEYKKVNTKNLIISYEGGEDFNFKHVKGKVLFSKTIKIKNTSNNDIYYNIHFKDLINKVNTSDLNYYILNGNDEVLSSTLFPKTNSSIGIYNNGFVRNNSSDKYKIVVTYSGKKIDKILSGKFEVGETKGVSKTFASILKENVKKIKTKPGKEIAKSDEGLIKQNNIYYYRGNVKNNYCMFGGYTWRIVGINSNDTVRLIMDDDLGESSVYNMNKDSNSFAQSKKMLAYSSSDIKRELEQWYNTRILGYLSEQVAVSSYCNDLNDVSKNFNVISRNSGKHAKPSVKCKGDEYNLPIGLINLDEVVLAGGMTNKTNKHYYLYDARNNYWIMSPANYKIKYHLVENLYVNMSDGMVKNAVVNNKLEIKPVISLIENISVTGKGTKKDPYVVK